MSNADRIRKLTAEAKEHVHKGNYQQAVDCYSEAIKLNPQRRELAIIHDNRGLIYYNRSQIQDALKDFNRSIEIDPQLDSAFFNRAVLFTVMGKYQNAIKDFSRAIDLQPHNAEYLAKRGDLFSILGKNIDSLEDYSTALDLDSGNVNALIGRSVLSARVGKYDSALGDLGRVLAVDPENGIAIGNRAQIFEMNRDFNSAFSDYSKLVKLEPNNPEILAKRSNVLLKLQNYEQAFNDVNKALKISPRSSDLYLLRAVVLDKMEKTDDSLKDLEKAVKLSPERDSAYLMRGIMLYNSGKTEKALKDFKKCLEINPENIDALEYAAVASRRLKDYAGAMVLFDRVSTMNPDRKGINKEKAFTYLLMGDRNLAAEQFRNQLERDPQDILNLAWLRFIAGKDDSIDSNLEKTGSNTWPGVVSRLMLKEITEDEYFKGIDETNNYIKELSSIYLAIYYFTYNDYNRGKAILNKIDAGRLQSGSEFDMIGYLLKLQQ